jgi:TolA-binding protein
MRTILVALLSASLCLAAAQTAKKKSGGPSPTALLMQLQSDVRTAMSHTELKEKDRKKLEKAIDKLQKQIDLRQQGKRMDPGDIRSAVDDISSVAKHFPEDDQRAVVRSINEIRDRKLDVERETQARKQTNPKQVDPLGRPTRRDPIYGPTTPRRR